VGFEMKTDTQIKNNVRKDQPSINLFSGLFGLFWISGAHGDVTVGVDPFSASASEEIPGFFTLYGSIGDINGLGETVTVPSGYPVLNSFSIYATSEYGGEAGLNAQVYEWSNATQSPVGSALFSSTAPTIYTPGTEDPLLLLTWDTGGIVFNPADPYLLEFTGDYSQGETDIAGIGSLFSGYSGGVEVDMAGGSYYPQTSPHIANLDFSADFSAVPEPGASALLIGALGVIAFWRPNTRSALV